MQVFIEVTYNAYSLMRLFKYVGVWRGERLGSCSHLAGQMLYTTVQCNPAPTRTQNAKKSLWRDIRREYLDFILQLR